MAWHWAACLPTAQSPSPAAPGLPPPVLDVPYLPQSELLCGGAAVAMVERWWGRRGVYAEDFAALVRPELRGIRTTDLAAASRARGWETRAFDGTPEEVRRILGQGVPVVALIEVAPDRYHYVVLLGWSDGRVTFHDPARAPSRVIDEARFLAEWSGAERWAMVLRPEPESAKPAVIEPRLPVPADSMPCHPWLDRALDAVATNGLEAASSLLVDAGRACPDEPLVLRELAGVRFKQHRLAEAVRLSGQYLERVPHDSSAWQLLAASRYISGDRDGALRAWNQIGLPVVDLVRVDGIHEVPFRIIASAVDVPHGTVLTPADLALARRRVADLAVMRRTAVDYQPVPGGRVEVRAAVVERPMLDPAWLLLATNTLRAITQRTVSVAIASPTGAGELWTGSWRWEHANPRMDLRIQVPARLGVSGVMDVEGTRELFRFAVDSARTGVLEESRRSAAVAFGAWISPALRPSAELRLEHWSGGREYLDVSTGAEFRAGNDRLVFATTGVYARALANNPSYTRGDVRAMWSSALGLSRPSWSARVGLEPDEPPRSHWRLAGGERGQQPPDDSPSRSSPDHRWPAAGCDHGPGHPARRHLGRPSGRPGGPARAGGRHLSRRRRHQGSRGCLGPRSALSRCRRRDPDRRPGRSTRHRARRSGDRPDRSSHGDHHRLCTRAGRPSGCCKPGRTGRYPDAGKNPHPARCASMQAKNPEG